MDHTEMKMSPITIDVETNPTIPARLYIKIVIEIYV